MIFKILKQLFIVHCSLLISTAYASDLFDPARPVEDGINVFEMSDTFAEIYEKLDNISWAGKNVGVAIESLESIDNNAHIAATDDRIVLVWRDSIVANYPRPAARNWREYGQITTALVLKFRARNTAMKAASADQLTQVVVDALVRGIDENGRYIYSQDAEIAQDNRILTSVGLEGGRDLSGNFVVGGIYKDSPADAGGVRAGDVITKINGADVMALSDEEITDAFSGFNSGTLKLTLAGDKQIVLRRASVVLADADIVRRQVTGNMEQGVLEIVIHKVSDNSVAIVNEALAKYSNASGIILDMRSARGDDELAAAKLAGLFLGGVPVMRIVQAAHNETEIVPGGDAVTDLPTVVLVSNTTMGTAEGIAGAFWENNRGVLIGTPTAGAARIATRIDLKNGGGLELLNKSIKTGKGNLIDGRGIFPIVCLSNIRSNSGQDAFFLNVINDDFNAQDFNGASEISPDVVRRGCPIITSGADEDRLSAAVAVKILTDMKIYNKLMDE